MFEHGRFYRRHAASDIALLHGCFCDEVRPWHKLDQAVVKDLPMTVAPRWPEEQFIGCCTGQLQAATTSLREDRDGHGKSHENEALSPRRQRLKRLHLSDAMRGGRGRGFGGGVRR